MQVPFSVPPHCKVTKVEITAETDEAFDRAVEQFGLKPLDVGPIATSDVTAYSFRYATGETEGGNIEITGPKKQLKITVADD